jgi:hypothetical protein
MFFLVSPSIALSIFPRRLFLRASSCKTQAFSAYLGRLTQLPFFIYWPTSSHTAFQYSRSGGSACTPRPNRQRSFSDRSMGGMRLAGHTPLAVPIEYIVPRLCPDQLRRSASRPTFLRPPRAVSAVTLPNYPRPQFLLPCISKWSISGDFSIKHPTAQDCHLLNSHSIPDQSINKFTCLRQLADHSRPSYSPGRLEFAV